MVLLSFSAVVAAGAATWAGFTYYDYSRGGEKLSKFAPLMGSVPNKTAQKYGREWTIADTLKQRFNYEGNENIAEDFLTVAREFFLSFFKTKKSGKITTKHRTLYIDEFRFFPKTVKKCSPFFLNKKAAEKVKIYFVPLDMTKSLLCVGSMGSGKTVFFLNLLFQRWYKRAIIRDAKGADFSPVIVDHKRSFVLNLYNKSAAVWDIMNEKHFLNCIGGVMLDFMTGAVGDSPDHKYFAGSAAERLEELFKEAYLKGTNSKARWAIFDKLFDEYKTRATAPKSIENKDVWGNILLASKTLKFWSYRCQNAEKTFSVSQFLNSDMRIILNGSEATMSAYFNAFISAVVDEMLRMPDDEENLTLFLLDEYLTFNISEVTKLKIHTMIRSKGGCVVSGLQYLPGDDTAKKQILDSSRFCTVLFNLQDTETTSHFKEYYGTLKYKETEVSTSRNKHDYVTGVSTSSQEREVHFLTEEELQQMPKYTHLTLLSTKEAYLGYTPYVSYKKIYNPLEDVFDLEKYERIQKGLD